MTALSSPGCLCGGEEADPRCPIHGQHAYDHEDAWTDEMANASPNPTAESPGAALCAALSWAWSDPEDASVFSHRARAVMEHLDRLGWAIVRADNINERH